MIFVGIDVAKDKHDCFILNSEGTVLADVFTIANNRIGFETLLSRIQSCSQGESKIKVGLEATGHYSYNLLGFLLDSGLATYVINPLHTNLYRKSLSLRRTKTDRIDARTIAMMLMSDVDLKSYSNTKSKTAEIQVAAGVSIGSKMPAKSMELKHTIALIRELDKEISEVESAIDKITSQMDSPIFTIPGIGRHMGAMILAEVGDFSNFASADKLLAYAGLSPSTYQSGQLQNCYAHMEKRGSRYLRYALFNAAKYVCLWCPTFSAYLEKKRSEGKHYNRQRMLLFAIPIFTTLKFLSKILFWGLTFNS
ncbi:transposase [Bacteroides sp.]|uniref:transposase n=1 Tax=Bacteroides sp. TaxID=29523 RepID=UPI00258C03B6|nr:transposase [Bacteroides sp.]